MGQKPILEGRAGGLREHLAGGKAGEGTAQAGAAMLLQALK